MNDMDKETAARLDRTIAMWVTTVCLVIAVLITARDGSAAHLGFVLGMALIQAVRYERNCRGYYRSPPER